MAFCLPLPTNLQVPVRFIGIGEAAEDMQTFTATEYVDALLTGGEQS